MTQFTIEELNKLVQMLDLATKAGGLSVAQEALPLVTKMQQMGREIEAAEGSAPVLNEAA